jgi:hypothetical protein
MMGRAAAILTAVLYLSAASAQTIEDRRVAIERIQTEAARFVESAPHIQGREALTQIHVPGIQRQIVSDYGFLALQPGEIKEIRQVELVDGKAVKKHGDALKELADSLMAADDKQRRKLLESFEKHGLQGVAADFGPVLQMFAGEKILKFEFIFQRMDRLNGAPVAVYRYEQIDGAGGLTIYSDGKPIRQKLRGEIWVRPGDGVPGRIVLDSVFEEGKAKLRDLTYVDYGVSELGPLLPLTVAHRQFRDRTILVQDVFRYSGYHRAQ